MRFNFRIKINSFTFFMMLAKTQTLEGMSSLLPNGKHMPMWDLEGCTLEQAEDTLRKVQQNYGLSNIYIVSDLKGSYRAWCFSQVDYKDFRRILSNTEYIDEWFFYYTVKRQKATCRTNNKKNRLSQQVVSVLESYYVDIPDKMEHVIYDTGLKKRGYSILLGDKDG